MDTKATKLTAADADGPNDYFGTSVAIFGDDRHSWGLIAMTM